MVKKKGSHASHSTNASHGSHQEESGTHTGAMRGNQTNFFENQGFTNALQNPFAGGQFGGYSAVNPWSETVRLGLAFDIFQDGENLIVEIPFPKLNPETLTIVQENRILKVSGSTECCGSAEKGGQTKIPLFIQIPYGYFEQIIHLPMAVQEDQTTASYEEGVLLISLKLIGAGRENRVPVSFA